MLTSHSSTTDNSRCNRYPEVDAIPRSFSVRLFVIVAGKACPMSIIPWIDKKLDGCCPMFDSFSLNFKVLPRSLFPHFSCIPVHIPVSVQQDVLFWDSDIC